MTKAVTRKMAVDCLLWAVQNPHNLRLDPTGEFVCFRCPECGDIILPDTPVQFDHRHADVHGGPHEFMNLLPIHAECHKAKSKRDVAAKAKGDRLLGLTCNKPKVKMRSKPFSKVHRPFQQRKNP